MTNRYIAFSTVTQRSLAASYTAADARDTAIYNHRLSSDDYIEVLDCGADGAAVWNANLLLRQARRSYRAVFRGTGYAPHLPAIEPQEVTP